VFGLQSHLGIDLTEIRKREFVSRLRSSCVAGDATTHIYNNMLSIL
jgi:hypothetical protein